MDLIRMKKIHYGILSTAQIVPRFLDGIGKRSTGEVTIITSRTLVKAVKMADKRYRQVN